MADKMRTRRIKTWNASNTRKALFPAMLAIIGEDIFYTRNFSAQNLNAREANKGELVRVEVV